MDGFRNHINLRDLGGMIASDGRVIKPGLIFRSGGLYLMNDEELERFSRFGVRSVLDLRTKEECAAKPDPSLEGVTVVQHSGLVSQGGEEIDFSPAGMHQLGDAGREQYNKLMDYYLSMPFNNEALRALMASLEAGEVPLVFHCATGKDRTGVAAMIVELALGVAEQDVLADYLLSNEYHAKRLAHSLYEHAAEFTNDAYAEKLIRMECGVLPEVGEGLLHVMRERYGSYEAYLEAEYGITDERLTSLRSSYLMDAEDDTTGIFSPARTVLTRGEDIFSGAVPQQAQRSEDCLSTEELSSPRAGELAIEKKPVVSNHQNVRILFTSDVHASVMPYSYATGEPQAGSFARLKTLIDQLRDENTLLIDGGDTVEGTPLSFYHERFEPEQVSPATRAMALLDYDYCVLGNHDFSYGTERLYSHLEHCGATALTANVMTPEGEPLGVSGVVRTIAGLRVGIVGATTQLVPHWESAKNLEGICFDDAYDAICETVEALREESELDLVIVAYHGGFEVDPTTGRRLSEDTGENQATCLFDAPCGIDVLLTGHQHRVYCASSKNRQGNTVTYVQPGYKGAQLACIDIDAKTCKVNASLIEVSTDIEPDKDVLACIAEEERRCQRWLDEPLGTCEVNLAIDDLLDAEIHKSQLVTFLNKVALEATGADLAGTALFVGATGFAPRITMRDLVSTYTFSNTLCVKQINGAQLKAYLERCAEYFALDETGNICVSPAFADPPQDYNYDMVDGVNYTIDVSRPVGSRIVHLEREGRSVTDSDSFTLVINNYRAAGGGDFGMLAEAPTVAENMTDMVELIANYILAHKTISFEPIDNIEVIAGASPNQGSALAHDTGFIR